MQQGMLWFENDPKKSLSTIIKEGSDYFEKKYGRKPTGCNVHRERLVGEKDYDKKFIRPDKSILKNHYLIGVE